QHVPFLDLACAFRDRVLDPFAGIHKDMFEVCAHTLVDTAETLALDAPPGCTQSCEIVLGSINVTGVTKVCGLDQHLEERNVPANPEGLTMAHVMDRELIIARIEARIARLQKRHEAAGGRAGRNGIAG